MHPTQESLILSCSPENNFLDDAAAQQKRISSTKLLHTESNTSSPSYTNHSGENSMESSLTEPMPVAELARSRRGSNSDDGNSYRTTNEHSSGLSTAHTTMENDDERDAEDEDEGEEPDQQITTSQPESASGNQTSSGVYSRRSSQPYKVGKYLVAVHRKITRHDSYFLSYHKTRPSLFGVPLLIPNSDGGTHKDLYCAVWLQVSRLLSPLPATTEQANHAADW